MHRPDRADANSTGVREIDRYWAGLGLAAQNADDRGCRPVLLADRLGQAGRLGRGLLLDRAASGRRLTDLGVGEDLPTRQPLWEVGLVEPQ